MATLKELLIERFSEEIKVLTQINSALAKTALELQKSLNEGKLADVRQAVNNVSVGPVNVAADISADVKVSLSLPEILSGILENLRATVNAHLPQITAFLRAIKDCVAQLKIDRVTPVLSGIYSKLCEMILLLRDKLQSVRGSPDVRSLGLLDLVNVIASLITIISFFGKRFFKKKKGRFVIRDKKTRKRVSRGIKRVRGVARVGKNIASKALNKAIAAILPRLAALRVGLTLFAAEVTQSGFLAATMGRVMGLLSPVMNIVRVGLMALGGLLAGLSAPAWVVIGIIAILGAVLFIFRDKIKAFLSKFDFISAAMTILGNVISTLFPPLRALGEALKFFGRKRKERKEEERRRKEEMAGRAEASGNDNAALTAFNLKPDDNLMLDNFLANPLGPASPDPLRVHQFSNNSSRLINNSPQFNTEVNVTASSAQSPEAIGRGIGKGLQKSCEASDIYYAMAEPRMA